MWCVQDLNLPKSIITRLAKGVLPPNTQIQANAILALSKSATVFISHLSNAYVSASRMTFQHAPSCMAMAFSAICFYPPFLLPCGAIRPGTENS